MFPLQACSLSLCCLDPSVTDTDFTKTQLAKKSGNCSLLPSSPSDFRKTSPEQGGDQMTKVPEQVYFYRRHEMSYEH